MKIRIGTWNIAAARKILSLDHFHYGQNEELGYFAEKIIAQDLDIFCVQESHINKNDSQAKRLANLLGMPYVAETPGCPSHIDTSYSITTAILAKLPYITEKAILLPYPTFELKFQHNNKVVAPYDRYAQIVTFDNFTIATTHTEPLNAFGLSYESGMGKQLADGIDLLLADELGRPLLFAADFNMHQLAGALPQTLKKFDLKDSLPDAVTRPHGTHPDHILHSSEWTLRDSGIVEAQSDHFLCWGEFELDN